MPITNGMTINASVESLFDRFENHTKNLTRAERIHARNEIIMSEHYSGLSTNIIASEFRLSERQTRKIIQEIKESAPEWYESLPKSTMIAIHRTNSSKIYTEINTMRNIRAITEDAVKKFQMSMDIIVAYEKYDKMVAEGATLQRQKELTDKAEKIILDAED